MRRTDLAIKISKIARYVSEDPSIDFATLFIGQGGRLCLGVYYTTQLSIKELTELVTKAGGPLLAEVLRHDPNLKARRLAPRLEAPKGWF